MLMLLRVTLIASFLVVAGFAINFGLEGETEHMLLSVAILGGVLLLALGDRLTELTMGLTGLSAKLKQVDEVRIELQDLQLLTATLAKSILTTAWGQGRLGGPPDSILDEMAEELDRVLKSIQIPDNRRDEIFKHVHNYTDCDYVWGILGCNTIPDSEGQIQQDWKALRGRFPHPPSPDELEEFLKTYDLLDEDRNRRLEDYRHYLKYRNHRNPNDWATRQTWPRLKP